MMLADQLLDRADAILGHVHHHEYFAPFYVLLKWFELTVVGGDPLQTGSPSSKSGTCRSQGKDCAATDYTQPGYGDSRKTGQRTGSAADRGTALQRRNQVGALANAGFGQILQLGAFARKHMDFLFRHVIQE